MTNFSNYLLVRDSDLCDGCVKKTNDYLKLKPYWEAVNSTFISELKVVPANILQEREIDYYKVKTLFCALDEFKYERLMNDSVRPLSDDEIKKIQDLANDINSLCRAGEYQFLYPPLHTPFLEYRDKVLIDNVAIRSSLCYGLILSENSSRFYFSFSIQEF